MSSSSNSSGSSSNSSSTVRIEAYYIREWNDFTMPVHVHARAEIMHVIRGECTVEVKGAERTMRSGDLVLIAAGVPHRLMVGKTVHCRMFNIEFVITDPLAADMQMIRKAAEAMQYLMTHAGDHVFLKDNEGVQAPLRDLLTELDGDQEDRDFMIQMLFTQVLMKIVRIYKELNRKPQARSNLYIRKALDFMNRNLDQPLTAERIADAVNIHQAYLHRIFKAATGKTLMGTLAELRLAKAKMLLARTEIPIIDLCAYVGLGSRQYFTQFFRKHTGMSPAFFRESHRQIVKSREGP